MENNLYLPQNILNMNKILQSITLLLLISSISSCYRVKVNAGHESVLIYKPYFIGHGGVEKDPISTGTEWCAWTTSHEDFIITPFTITEHFKDMIPSDNTPVSFDVYLKVQIKKGETPTLCEKFGSDWYNQNLQSSFRTMVRDKACVYKMFDLASKREISSKLEQEILKDIIEYAQRINIPVTILQVSIGAITPPEQVLIETKLTAAQNQSVLTQTARAFAELSRKDAERNKAIADNAYRFEMGMTMDQYLQLRHLEIEKEKVELIKDHDNVSIIFGNGVTPSFPIK